MNAKQEAKLNMYRAVERQGDENPTVVAEVPAFQTAFNRLKAKIAEITGNAQQKDVVLTGITTDKTVSKQTLCQKTADAANIVFAYAVENADETLKAEVNFSLSKLLKTRDDQLAPRCQNVHDRASANRAALADYGITARILADLQTAITDYSASTPKPRTAASHRKMLNANLATLFKETDTILVSQMDKLISALKPAHPDFVREYESNRQILDPPTRPRAPNDAPGNNTGNTPS